ncbi:MAG: hypothetical protein AAB348_01775 [Patescibacteria group bacterium]
MTINGNIAEVQVRGFRWNSRDKCLLCLVQLATSGEVPELMRDVSYWRALLARSRSFIYGGFLTLKIVRILDVEMDDDERRVWVLFRAEGFDRDINAPRALPPPTLVFRREEV